MTPTDTTARDYRRIEKALRFVADNYRAQPDLADIAAALNLSEAHLQRLFSRWAGVSPKQFLQYLTLDHAQRCLRSDMSVLDAALDSGLSAPARLNELFVRLESVTPTEFRQHGKGITVDYGFHETPFGLCLIGVTNRGLSGLEFCDQCEPCETENSVKERALASMTGRMKAASYSENSQRTAEYADLVFSPSNRSNPNDKAPDRLPVLIKGTPFQLKVWQALLRIPLGARVSYKQLAIQTGSPRANQAVGSAVGKNPVALLIPCHRVLREDGLLGGYRWGLERKLAFLGCESAQLPKTRNAENS